MKRIMIRNSIMVAESRPEFEQYLTKTSIDLTEHCGIEPVDTDLNEWYLWHGTSIQGAEAICKIDFKQRLAGSATGTLYGKGTYFAESITKADEYAKETDDCDDDDDYDDG